MNAKGACALLAALLLLPAAALAQGYAGLAPTPPASPRSPPRPTSPSPATTAPTPASASNGGTSPPTSPAPTAPPTARNGPSSARRPRPDGERPGWQSPQIWMAHAAATSATAHRFAETFARGGIGQAGVTLAPFRAWIDDWSMTAPPTTRPRPPAPAGRRRRLRLRPHPRHRPPPGPPGRPRLQRQVRARPGLLLLQPALLRRHRPPHPRRPRHPRHRPAPGSTANGPRQPLAQGQHGWDWFALHLDDGARVMIYRMRQDEGAYLAGTWIDAATAPRTRSAPTRSPPPPAAPPRSPAAPSRSNGASPSPTSASRWTPPPLNAQSWNGTAFAYWEGPIRVTGSHAGPATWR